MKILKNKEYEEMQTQISECERRTFDLKKRLINACKRIDELKTTISNLTISNNNFVLKIKEQGTLLHEKGKNIKECYSRVGGLTKFNNKLKTQNDELTNEVVKLNKIISKMTSEANQNQRDSTILAEKVIELKRENKKMQQEKEALQLSIVKLNEKLKISSSSKNAKNYLRREEIKNENN